MGTDLQDSSRAVKVKTNINPLLVAIPASCDVCSSTLLYISLVLVPASVYEMMRGFIVVITATLSIIFLKKKQYRHHFTGLFFIFAGVMAVGYASVAGEKANDSAGRMILGIALLFISQLFSGTMLIIEERFFGEY